MHSFGKKTGWFELEEFVDAFEEAQVRDGEADLAEFLPSVEHPNRRDIVLELIRVDLEYRWQRGETCLPDRYRARFPELFDDPHAAGQVEFELDRLRRRKMEEFPFPEVGDDFLGFQLVGELGRGAFGKVYLAEQAGLANRTVALKVSKLLFGESQTLAQLQHTNIVPIYSVHVRWPFQAVCMPYLGGTTLADVLKQLRGNAAPPDSGLDLLSTLRSGTPFGRRGSSTFDEKRAAAADHAGSKTSASGAGRPRAADPISPGAASCAHDAAKPAELDRIPRARLASLSYVEAVLWIVARLADGLNHAHARGVLHRDLKPANILLTDEGQPMLLDFNLSSDALAGQTAATARMGGTLQYMSPEQLAALEGKEGNTLAVDSRSDVYSLGVVLYELLSLRHPFPLPAEGGPPSLADAQARRRQAPPSLARLNRAVSPAVESMVCHALAADPSRRYHSAQELQEDIERQLAHQPLRHATEPSWRERAAKWVRRHPRLTSHTGVALVGLMSLVLAAGAWFLVGRQQARVDALERWRDFEARLPAVLFRLNGAVSSDREGPADTLASGRELLELYRVEDDDRWYDRQVVSNLDDRRRRALRDHAGGLSLSIAAAIAGGGADPGTAAQALRWNRLAERCFLPEERPGLLWRQRAELLRELGGEDEAKTAEALAAGAATRPALDHYWHGFERAQRHDYREAVSALQAATEDDPQLFWGWFQLGVCNDALGTP